MWVQGYPQGTLDGGAKNSALGVTATVTLHRAVVTQTGSAMFDESSEDEEDHDEGVQDGEWEMKDNEEAYEELDDDFDEFMSPLVHESIE